jgi:predicted transcriptional regulator YdeE
MQPEIKRAGPIRIVGYVSRFLKSQPGVMDFRNAIETDGRLKELHNAHWKNGDAEYGITIDLGGNEFDYIYGVEASFEKAVPMELADFEIPSGDFAVFTLNHKDEIAAIYPAADAWEKSSNRKFADYGLIFEIYSDCIQIYFALESEDDMRMYG